jgi:hypothetical protein
VNPRRFERGDHVELGHALLDVLRAQGGEIVYLDQRLWRITDEDVREIPAYEARRIVADFAGSQVGDGGRVLRIFWSSITGAIWCARMCCAASPEQAERIRRARAGEA